jgi:FMN-dependent NADH-azoreductase
MTLLRIDSSARASSVSRHLTSLFVDAWRSRPADGHVIECDLAKTVLPPLANDWSATYRDASLATAAERQYLSVSDTLRAELYAADVIVISSPMYKLSISAELKAWIDHVVRLGKTMAVDNRRSHGLLHGRSAIVVTSRGGSYRDGSPRAPADFQEPCLREILGAIGLTDVTFVHAEHQGNPVRAEEARAIARERLQQLANLTEEIHDGRLDID